MNLHNLEATKHFCAHLLLQIFQSFVLMLTILAILCVWHAATWFILHTVTSFTTSCLHTVTSFTTSCLQPPEST